MTKGLTDMSGGLPCEHFLDHISAPILTLYVLTLDRDHIATKHN